MIKLQIWIQIILSVTILFSGSADAFSDSDITFEGNIHSFDEKQVEVISDNVVYVVPRSYILLSGLKAGQKINVTMDRNQFKDLKKNPVGKK